MVNTEFERMIQAHIRVPINVILPKEYNLKFDHSLFSCPWLNDYREQM